MPRQIVQFETDDGHIFDTMAKAEQWEKTRGILDTMGRFLRDLRVDIPEVKTTVRHPHESRELAQDTRDVLAQWLMRWRGHLMIIFTGGTIDDAFKE